MWKKFRKLEASNLSRPHYPPRNMHCSIGAAIQATRTKINTPNCAQSRRDSFTGMWKFGLSRTYSNQEGNYVPVKICILPDS